MKCKDCIWFAKAKLSGSKYCKIAYREFKEIVPIDPDNSVCREFEAKGFPMYLGIANN